MKNALNAIIIIVLTLLTCASCQQEQILEEVEPTLQHNQIPTQIITSPKDTTYNQEYSIKELNIAVKTYSCSIEGIYAKVYNPNFPQILNWYDANIYVVEWYQDNKLQHVGTQAGCFCGKPVTIIITDLRDNSTGRVSFTPPPCKYRPISAPKKSHKPYH